MASKGPIEAHLSTDTGRVREHNEDFVAFWEPSNPEEEQLNGWLYLVADGVGGADAGEVASQYASERTLANFKAYADEPDWGTRLLDAMQAANLDLRQLVAERNDNSRMATTMVTALIVENKVFIGNVGDSRGYHWRNGQLRQVTKDQSLVAKLVEEGAITEAEAHLHPRRNVILYSLGSDKQPQIDLFELTLESGDILLLCSDGLTRHVANFEMADVIRQQRPEEAVDTLIRMANQRGGEDNISAGVIRYTGTGSATGQGIDEPTTAHDLAGVAEASAVNRSALWLYTGCLALVLIFLIFLSWLALRV